MELSFALQKTGEAKNINLTPTLNIERVSGKKITVMLTIYEAANDVMAVSAINAGKRSIDDKKSSGENIIIINIIKITFIKYSKRRSTMFLEKRPTSVRLLCIAKSNLVCIMSVLPVIVLDMRLQKT
ncbi:hypothetical protein [Nitratireductor rhodophyticola]|uniref:hypothetical protein n=1 Tax=Nitratireductor rhodophyticola TaxID=2854036 RepID=UPI001CA76AD0|nr:hypothetical protein [Nitratireductor rhodophyticola]